MAELDFVSIIIPGIISAVIAFIILGINKLGKTSEGTLTGTIRLENVTSGMKQMEERIDKNFERVQQSLTKIWDELEEIKSGHRLNTYRLDKIERNHKDE